MGKKNFFLYTFYRLIKKEKKKKKRKKKKYNPFIGRNKKKKKKKKMNTLKARFLTSKNYAVVGASTNPEKFGYKVLNW